MIFEDWARGLSVVAKKEVYLILLATCVQGVWTAAELSLRAGSLVPRPDCGDPIQLRLIVSLSLGPR